MAVMVVAEMAVAVVVVAVAAAVLVVMARESVVKIVNSCGSGSNGVEVIGITNGGGRSDDDT